MSPVSTNELMEVIPYAILVLGSIYVLFTSLALNKKSQNWALAFSTSGFSLTALMSLMWVGHMDRPFEGMLIHDRVGMGFSALILILLALAAPVFSSQRDSMDGDLGSTFGLLLLSGCGGLLMIFANHFLVFFIGLEILSLPLYVLTGLGKNRVQGTEAAFKYFILGAISSALFVYGAALLWGAYGTLTLSDMTLAKTESATFSPQLVTIGLTLTASGILFKLGVVPFHMWVPDVYEGAPSLLVSWMSGAVKAAACVFLLRLFGTTFNHQHIGDISTILVGISVVSMIWGSVAALQQENIKRMLAYSSIASAGYGLIGIVCAQLGEFQAASTALIYYFFTYGVGTLAAFSVIALEEIDGRVNVTDFAGLAKRKPVLAFIFSLSLLSLAGLPPLAGFFGKFNLFSLAVKSEHSELVVAGVLTSVISIVYYLRVLISVYMVEPVVIGRPNPKFATMAILVIAAFLLVSLGVMPSWVIDLFSQTPIQANLK